MLYLFSRLVPGPPLQLRWLIPNDLPAVLQIAADSFDYPWLEKDFYKALQVASVLGNVAERRDRIVGYAIYEVHMHGITLLNLAVDPDARRAGVGRTLFRRLVSTLDRSCAITAIVNERNLTAQLWFKALGAQATQVLHGFFGDRLDDPPEDGYRFCYPVGDATPATLH
jgi:ribosomal-protein-alanine N-acetyltransferase